MAPVIRGLISLLWIICYPISLALDYFLGTHSDHVRFAKKDLKTLIQLHEAVRNINSAKSEPRRNYDA